MPTSEWIKSKKQEFRKKLRDRKLKTSLEKKRSPLNTSSEQESGSYEDFAGTEFIKELPFKKPTPDNRKEAGTQTVEPLRGNILSSTHQETQTEPCLR